MVDSHELTSMEKDFITKKTGGFLSVINGRILISGPTKYECTVHDQGTHQKQWTDYIYDIDITGDYGKLSLTESFSGQIDEKRMVSIARYIADQYWSQKDGDINGILYNRLYPESI